MSSYFIIVSGRGIARLAALILLLIATFIPLSAQQTPPPDKKTPAPQQPTTTTAEPKPAGQAPRVSIADRSDVTLGELNVEIDVDRRVIVTMAALNIAGYDYESGNRQLSSLRKQIREDLKNTNPALVEKLKAHFQARRTGKSDVLAVAPYLSLALSLTEPPAFTLEVPTERLPEDVREILDFALLLQEFYQSTGFSRIMPKYVAAYVAAANKYGEATALAVSSVISYLHTEPVLELPPLYVSRPQPAKRGEKEERFVAPNRIRRFIIMPDLLNTTGSANLRTVRDTYFLLLGPTTEPNVEAMRRAYLSFVIDPLTERAIKEVLALRDDLKKLLESRGDKLEQEYALRSAYYMITDSLVRATDARMTVVGTPVRRNYTEMDAIYDLSLAYERGAVLVFHFYDKMSAFEKVGINLKDYFTDLIQRVDFEKERNRLDDYAARLARHKQMKLEATMAPAPAPTMSNSSELTVTRILEADQLIKARRYDEAKTVLEAVRKESPNNARALFGLADVTSKKASQITDSDRLAEELYAAVELYKMAAENALLETEKWLAQRSYVAAGKILEFLGDSSDAEAALDLAIKMGESVDKAAYDEAVKAKLKKK